MPHPLLPLLLLVLFLVGSGCSTTPTSDAAAQIQVVGGGSLPNLVDTGQPLSFSGLVGQLLKEDVVYVGERHDDFSTQQMQLALIESLHRSGVKLAIGVEWLQRPFQAHLDAFIAGDIDEAELLRRTQYFSRWGHDYRQYRPILRFALNNKIPMIALNAPSELIQAIMQGGLKSLDDFYVAQLPEEYYFTNQTYQERLQQIYHQHRNLNSPFSHFYEVQLTWDETMAEEITRFLERDAERTLVVLAGTGHLEYGHGIPDRVLRRTELPGKILLPTMPNQQDPGIADFLLRPPPARLPPIGWLGVALPHRPQRPLVEALHPDGPALRAGLRPGDRILSLNQQPVQDYTDLRLALLGTAPGQRVDLEIETGKGQQRTLQLMLAEAGKDPRGHL